MADIALWDVVAPYFLLGNASGNWQAPCPYWPSRSTRPPPTSLASSSGAGCSSTATLASPSTRGTCPSPSLPRTRRATRGTTPTRREPWIDLRDTTIDFAPLAPREGSATIAAGESALTGEAGAADTLAVLTALDAPPVEAQPTNHAATAFVLDLVITSAVLCPPFLSPATTRADGLLEPDPSVDPVRLTLPRVKLRFAQTSVLDATTSVELLSLGDAGLDDGTDDFGVLRAVAMGACVRLHRERPGGRFRLPLGDPGPLQRGHPARRAPPVRLRRGLDGRPLP